MKLFIFLASVASAAATLTCPQHLWTLKESCWETTADDTGCAPEKVRLSLIGDGVGFLGPPKVGAQLDGASEILFPNGLSFAGTDGVTVAAWVRYDSFTAAGTLFAFDDCNGNFLVDPHESNQGLALVKKLLRENGLIAMFRGHILHATPPLIIEEEELRDFTSGRRTGRAHKGAADGPRRRR